MSVRDDLKRATDKLKEKPAAENASAPAKAIEGEATPPIGEGITNAPPVSAAAAETVLTGTTKHAGGRPIVGAEKASKRVSLLMMPSRFAELDAISRQRRTPINALINEAIEAWLSHKQ